MSPSTLSGICVTCAVLGRETPPPMPFLKALSLERRQLATLLRSYWTLRPQGHSMVMNRWSKPHVVLLALTLAVSQYLHSLSRPPHFLSGRAFSLFPGTLSPSPLCRAAGRTAQQGCKGTFRAFDLSHLKLAGWSQGAP